ncbi:DUF6262 family protein [Microbacterium limosum]|uniref:DUF6262 family protein n=1 Tax=Microbacterium limosum TaxID=3079935 RepID=A0AAU0MKG0_9MICO|nr:DUF6262 family protein [Microbacterium sp. Y20]WOQ70958.1 DUF6262 family protein [Microbacterium sp. Y20]
MSREHLAAAARRRTVEATERATRAVDQMERRHDRINFVAVAERAGVSTDFLYRHTDLRVRIERLRVPRPRRGEPVPATTAEHMSAAVRQLAQQLKRERAAHREEVTRLERALEAAHGENLQMRRRRDGGVPR